MPGSVLTSRMATANSCKRAATGLEMMRQEFNVHSEESTSGVGSQRMPVIPSTILSTGPPLLQAMTGFPAAIASSGTIPKCSFSGVYITHVQSRSSSSFSWALMDGSNNTSRQMPSSRASLSEIKSREHDA